MDVILAFRFNMSQTKLNFISKLAIPPSVSQLSNVTLSQVKNSQVSHMSSFPFIFHIQSINNTYVPHLHSMS